MQTGVYIRPLVLEDAQTSYQWRNNPRIWKYTGSKPDKVITPEIESEWLLKVLSRRDEKRFAICLRADDTYIGNVFFTDIREDEAEIHIFIGEMKYWGEGRAIAAIRHLMDYGFDVLKLNTIYARINKANFSSIAVGVSCGFKVEDEYFDEQKNMTLVKLIFTREMMEGDLSSL